MGCTLSCFKCFNSDSTDSRSTSNVGKKHRPVPAVPLPNLMKEDYNNDFKFEPYYFGNITRYDAEQHLLLQQANNGAFLIRDTNNSYNSSHKYSLSG